MKAQNSVDIHTALQYIREVLEPRYIESFNERFETNLRLSSLINKEALAEELKTHNVCLYNDVTIEQVLTFHFAENRQNVAAIELPVQASPISCLSVMSKHAGVTIAVSL